MNYEEFLITLSDIAPEEAYDILYFDPNHEFKRAYELIISKDAWCSYHYARDVRGRFELGENVISKNSVWAYHYAKDVIRGRFELGENVISKNSIYSYIYAKDVIRGRFELGEETIRNSIYKNDYAKFVMKNPNFWDET